ncbi:MAG: hypothetical protein IJ779_02200 [Ruminococcus sp.]|nr:hypothetical protein [Ruminococcus sp.]
MKEIYLSNEKVKYIGRVYADGEQLWLTQSGSGCEFLFSGTKLSICLSCDDDSLKENYFRNKPRVAVTVDGRFCIKKVIEEKDETYTVISSDTPVTAVVSIIKLSEAAFSLCSVKAAADGTLSPTPTKPKRIEFIGDSITCGYGVDDSNTQSNFSAEAENAMKSYAFRCAGILGTEYSLFSYSGYGIFSGWTENGDRNTREVLPPHYEKFCHSYKRVGSTDLDKLTWDFSSQPNDMVVINLGTNDNSFCIEHNEAYAYFENDYYEFLRTVHRCNPEAVMVAAIGLINVTMNESIHKAVQRFTAETGVEVHEFCFTPQDGKLGYGSNWHPSAETQQYAAEELADFIKGKHLLD